MCRTFGYCRISTPTQNIERQERNIRAAYSDAIMLKEAFTGTKTEGRTQFEKLMRTVKSGDTIVFDSVSRMSRDANEGFELYQKFFEQGVELVFLKERHIDTATYKEAMERQISTNVNSGDTATDELIESITAAINRYMMRLAEQQIRIAFVQAEKEVKDLQQRTREGIETARLSGKQIGGVEGRKLNVKKAEPMKEKIRKYSKDFGGELNDVEAIKLIGIARNTYYKYKRELKE